MTAPLRIAVLSFAHTHALSYVHALQAMPGIELIATDPDGAAAPDDALRGADLATELGVSYVDDYDAAFAWKPDAVVIAAENSRHRGLVERAASAGAHVLCETPLATTVDDAVAMQRACDEAGVMLMVAYPVRFSPVVRDALAELRAGRLGRILSVTGVNNGKLPGDRAWFTDPDLAGGGAGRAPGRAAGGPGGGRGGADRADDHRPRSRPLVASRQREQRGHGADGGTRTRTP